MSTASFSILSVCIYNTQCTWDVLAGVPSLLYHMYKKKKKKVRNKGQNRSHYFFSSTSEINVRLGAWQAVPIVPLKADLFSSVFNSINTTFFFSFLLSIPKDWQLYIILLLSVKWIIFHNGLRWDQNKGNKISFKKNSVSGIFPSFLWIMYTFI